MATKKVTKKQLTALITDFVYGKKTEQELRSFLATWVMAEPLTPAEIETIIDNANKLKAKAANLPGK